MPDALRSRVMAPVYALIVSFCAVLVLGAAADREGTTTTSTTPPPATAPPATSAPEPAAPVFRLITEERDGLVVRREPASGLAGKRVEVLTGGGPVVVGEGAELSVGAGSRRVCVLLPEGWTAPPPAHRLDGRVHCWDVTPRADGTPVNLVVTGPGR
ncbi:hypothetical protein [Saccharothrix sp. Mg75]|uniref:hypothetical protein n=1 Tax=Saccharothrix sp. Mg75 TaxID=3445357 RepID=UPI003EEC9E96